MKIDDIRNHVAQDLTFDDTELDREALRIPQIHNKYLNFLSDERLALKALQMEYDKLSRLKWEYYTGKMDQDQLEKHGWQPFQLRILKQDVDLYMRSDDDLLIIRSKIERQNEKVDYLESVLKGIMNRHWQIRSAIEWRKFTSGVN
jgi:hypothetical protein